MSARMHEKKRRSLSVLERGIEELARRRARKQLLAIPWIRFRPALVAYPRWLAFTLWTQAILVAAGHAPPPLLAILRRRCPDLIDPDALSIDPGLLVPRLQQWVHTNIFRHAKQEGWLDALIFFGVRDLRSQAAWSYWEDCESRWRRRRPSSYPTFEKWWRTARNRRFCHETSAAQIARALGRYIELHAFASWLQPILEANPALPAGLAQELQRRWPGFLEFHNRVALGEQKPKGGPWPQLLEWIEDHCFKLAKKQGWFAFVVQQARNDPRHVRLVEFSKRSMRGGLDSAREYPSFDQWRRAVDAYVEKRAN